MRNKRFRLGVAAVVVGVGLVALPASPAAADPVTYPDVQCEIRFPGDSAHDETWTWTMEGEGPSEPVAPGSTFTLSGLTVIQHAGFNNHEGELTVLGQVIDLGRSFSEVMDGQVVMVWGPMDVELVAPTEFGVHDIVPQATWNQAQTGTSLGTFCPREGEAFPDDPFASVEVADVEPTTTTTTTTTTTVPVNGNGNGTGTGDDVAPGVDPPVDPDGTERVVRDQHAVTATPTFTG